MVIDFSHKNIFKILSTETRKADLTSNQLAEVHKKLGRLLSHEVLEYVELEEIDIHHVQGIRKGLLISGTEKFLFLVLMRGGLYMAEGMKEIFDGHYSMEFLFDNNIENVLEKYENLSLYNLLICDSVINTGKSIDRVLEVTKNFKFKRTFIATLVLQDKIVDKYEKQKGIILLTARISTNFYVGKGKTDTGNRLFNNPR